MLNHINPVVPVLCSLHYKLPSKGAYKPVQLLIAVMGHGKNKINKNITVN
jgi:hypothetical protein